MGEAEWPYATLMCSELDLNGKSDWFLPSSEELLILLNFESDVIYFRYHLYWSSIAGEDYFTAKVIDYVMPDNFLFFRTNGYIMNYQNHSCLMRSGFQDEE